MNLLLAHLFMICSNIELTGPVESIGIQDRVIHKQNQSTRILILNKPSWPGLSRPSTSFATNKRKTWMPGTSPGMTRVE